MVLNLCYRLPNKNIASDESADMTKQLRVDMWFSLQSDYCYFLIDRLHRLAAADVEVVIRPVLGLVLRMPESTRSRSKIEQDYFVTDTKRTAEYLGLPHTYPEPPPIKFEPNSWVASDEQPFVELLYSLFVGAVRQGKALEFLDSIVRKLWDGSQPGWNETSFLKDGMSEIGLDHDTILVQNKWPEVSRILAENHDAMLNAGHWGVPLMIFEGEPFYGQDRFDQLIWRMGIKLD